MSKRFSVEAWKQPTLQGASIDFATNEEDRDIAVGILARDGSKIAATILDEKTALQFYQALGEELAARKMLGRQ